MHIFSYSDLHVWNNYFRQNINMQTEVHKKILNPLENKIKIKTILKEITLQLQCHKDVSMGLPVQRTMWQEALLITSAKRDLEG